MVKKEKTREDLTKKGMKWPADFEKIPLEGMGVVAFFVGIITGAAAAIALLAIVAGGKKQSGEDTWPGDDTRWGDGQ